MTVPSWFPTAPRENLVFRAAVVASIRAFLGARGYLEVETPLLSRDVVVDTHLDPFWLDLPTSEKTSRFFLQTSPEFAMKRLLAAGSGSIFQIAHAFRAGEVSLRHNPEFTLVEWYQVGGDYHALMTEVGDLVSSILRTEAPARETYRSAFLRLTEIDPLAAPAERLRQRAAELGLAGTEHGRDELLQFLLASLVEPHLGVERPMFLYDYPPGQAALAEVDPGPPPVARRFELYVRGIELCNGYQELTDAAELRRRALENNEQRRKLGKPTLPVESRLLEAMAAGLPRCAGVALGLDRLVMLAAKADTLGEIVPFPFDRA